MCRRGEHCKASWTLRLPPPTAPHRLQSWIRRSTRALPTARTSSGQGRTVASVLSWPKARGVWRAATDRRTKRRQHLRAVQEGPGDPLAPADHVAPARGKSKDLARSPGPRPGPGESCGLAQPPPLPAPAGLHAAQGANTPSSPCFTSSPHPTSALERNAEVPGIDGGLRGEIEGTLGERGASRVGG